MAQLICGYRVVHGTAGTSAVWFQTGDGKTPGSGSDDCVGYIQFHAGTRRTAKPLAEGKTAGGAVGR